MYFALSGLQAARAPGLPSVPLSMDGSVPEPLCGCPGCSGPGAGSMFLPGCQQRRAQTQGGSAVTPLSSWGTQVQLQGHTRAPGQWQWRQQHSHLCALHRDTSSSSSCECRLCSGSCSQSSTWDEKSMAQEAAGESQGCLTEGVSELQQLLH